MRKAGFGFRGNRKEDRKMDGKKKDVVSRAELERAKNLLWDAWREAVSRHNDMANHFDPDDWLSVRRDFLQWYGATTNATQDAISVPSNDSDWAEDFVTSRVWFSKRGGK